MAKNTEKKGAEAKKAAPKYNEKITKAIEVIKASQPHVKVVYFNANGDYHFHKRDGFKAVNIDGSAEEDIDLGAEVEETEPTEDTGAGELGKGGIEF